MFYEVEDVLFYGECLSMCPRKEANMRLENGLIHILETAKSKKKSSEFNPDLAIKCFQMSTASIMNICNEKLLRVPEVLLQTVNYLLTDIILDDRLPWSEVCDFICDRLRAVRQDLAVQEVPSPQCLQILEPIVRFHVYAAYRLSGVPISEFDPQLNKDHLSVCLDLIFAHYNKLRRYETSKNVQEMEALYLIINLGNNDAILRGFKTMEHYKGKDLKAAVEISLAWYRGDYFSVLKQLKSLSPILQAALVAFKIAEIRRHVLNIMSVAYSCKKSFYPVECLVQLLLYNSISTAEEDCNYYNLKVTKGSVTFKKDSFDLQKEVIARRENCLNKSLQSNMLSHLLLRTSKKKYYRILNSQRC